MKELETRISDKEQIAHIAPVRSITNIGMLKPHKGHSCYELNLETGIIGFAEFKVVNAAISENPLLKGASYIKKTLVVKKNCLYASALNMENAETKFKKMFPKQKLAQAEEKAAVNRFLLTYLVPDDISTALWTYAKDLRKQNPSMENDDLLNQVALHFNLERLKLPQ